MSYKYFFLTVPSSWDTFLSQHHLFPSTITTFDASNCYWLPVELICGAVVKMKNLEKLLIKGTKMSLPHLAKVFGSCKKITTLDFNHVEKDWDEVEAVVSKESMEIIIQGFQKLICLKMSTRFHDARDYVHDPWVLIIRMLRYLLYFYFLITSFQKK